MMMSKYSFNPPGNRWEMPRVLPELRGYFSLFALFALVFCIPAHAKTGLMTWYVRSNEPIAKTVSAISSNLSAQCNSNIKTGKITMIINGKKQILTPERNYASFPQINGAPQSNGKFSYNYSILWTAPEKVMGVFALTCRGDNHR